MESFLALKSTNGITCIKNSLDNLLDFNCIHEYDLDIRRSTCFGFSLHSALCLCKLTLKRLLYVSDYGISDYRRDNIWNKCRIYLILPERKKKVYTRNFGLILYKNYIIRWIFWYSVRDWKELWMLGGSIPICIESIYWINYLWIFKPSVLEQS